MRLVLGTDAGVRVVERRASGWTPGPVRPDGHDVHDLARFQGALFAATYGESVWRSDDDGRTWAPASEGLAHPVVRSLLPHDGALLAGTEPARAFRSRDGRSWTELGLGRLPEAGDWWLPYSPRAGALRHLIADRAIPRRVYGAIEVGGVAVSDDAGETWSLLNDGLHEDVHALAQSPDGELYAATGGGFFRLVRREGASASAPGWRGVHKGIEREYVGSVAALSGGVILIAGAWGPGEASEIYRSADRGRSFARAMSGLPREFRRMVWALAAADGAVYLGSSEGTLFSSDDAGLTWRPLAEGLGAVQAIVVEA